MKTPFKQTVMALLRPVVDPVMRLLDSGYRDPSLKDTFNALAQSPFGLHAIDFCKEQDYKIIATDAMKENILGTCDLGQIRLRPHSCHSVMAHEMRHAFQMHHMKTHVMSRYNPVFSHMEIRMTEADAFTFSTLVNVSRWKALGMSPDSVHRTHRHNTSRIDVAAYRAYANHHYDPRVLLQILRSAFDHFYFKIAAYPGVFSYEEEGMRVAKNSYKALERGLAPSRTMIQMVTHTMNHPDQQIFLEKALHEYRNTGNLVDDLAHRLGQIPGLKGNYLTDTVGHRLSHDFYLGALSPQVQEFHSTWQRKIGTYIRHQHHIS